MANKFTTSWRNYYPYLQSNARSFIATKEFVDVTICSDKSTFHAHKFLLAVCSPYFHEVLKKDDCAHSTIILAGIEDENIEDILQFIYYGDVRVNIDRITTFLETVERLQIIGLSLLVDTDEMKEHIRISRTEGRPYIRFLIEKPDAPLRPNVSPETGTPGPLAPTLPWGLPGSSSKKPYSTETIRAPNSPPPGTSSAVGQPSTSSTEPYRTDSFKASNSLPPGAPSTYALALPVGQPSTSSTEPQHTESSGLPDTNSPGTPSTFALALPIGQPSTSSTEPYQTEIIGVTDSISPGTPSALPVEQPSTSSTEPYQRVPASYLSDNESLEVTLKEIPSNSRRRERRSSSGSEREGNEIRTVPYRRYSAPGYYSGERIPEIISSRSAREDNYLRTVTYRRYSEPTSTDPPPSSELLLLNIEDRVVPMVRPSTGRSTETREVTRGRSPSTPRSNETREESRRSLSARRSRTPSKRSSSSQNGTASKKHRRYK